MPDAFRWDQCMYRYVLGWQRAYSCSVDAVSREHLAFTNPPQSSCILQVRSRLHLAESPLWRWCCSKRTNSVASIPNGCYLLFKCPIGLFYFSLSTIVRNRGGVRQCRTPDPAAGGLWTCSCTRRVRLTCAHPPGNSVSASQRRTPGGA